MQNMKNFYKMLVQIASADYESDMGETKSSQKSSSEFDLDLSYIQYLVRVTQSRRDKLVSLETLSHWNWWN